MNQPPAADPITDNDFLRWHNTLGEIGQRLAYGLRSSDHAALQRLGRSLDEIQAGDR